MSDPLTTEQQKARAYYLQNRERCIENAQRYRLQHHEENRRYQAEYFQRFKKTAKYKEMQEKRSKERQQQSEVRKKLKAERKAKEKAEKEQQMLPLTIERSPTPPTIVVDPEVFTVKFL